MMMYTKNIRYNVFNHQDILKIKIVGILNRLYGQTNQVIVET